MRTPYERKKKAVPKLKPVEVPDFAYLLRRLLASGFNKLPLARELQMTREKLYSLLEGRYKPEYAEGLRILQMYHLTTIKEQQ